LPTSLSGTSVTFDGAAAPIFFASDRLVIAQAPTNLAAGATTQVQLRSNAGTSRTVPMEVVAVKPGILTYEAGGAGQAKATNQDGTANGDASVSSSAQGATPGSIVAVYATGLGAVNPAIAQGTPAPSSPVSVATMPISATVGGRAAEVTYAGAAPGLIGTYQVNVRVPAGTPRGNVAVVLTAGGNASQANATILIR
jgi:adhesin/invasin